MADWLPLIIDDSGQIQQIPDGDKLLGYFLLDQTAPQTVVGVPEFPDLKLTDNVLGTPTYSTISDFINIMSAGLYTHPVITDIGGGNVSVGAFSGMVQITNSDIATNKFFDSDGTASLALTNDQLNYIYYDYNGGTPLIATATSFASINGNTQFCIGLAYLLNGEVEILEDGVYLPNFRDTEWHRLEHLGVQRYSGGLVAETGIRYLTVTGAQYYKNYIGVTSNPIDTSGVTDRFTYVYRDGALGWTFDDNGGAGWQQVSNTLYDDDSGAPKDVGAAKYAIYWVYQCLEGDIYIQMGQYGNNNILQAQTKQPPTPPNYLAKWATLLGKIIVLKGSTNFTEIQNTLSVNFTSTTSSEHNNLTGLQGGTSGEYYHLTSAQHSGYNNSNWDTAYGWGNHASAGYLTSLAGAVLVSQTTPQSIGDTTDRLTKLWAINAEFTNVPTIGGNALGTIYAAVAQTFYIGTTQVAINRASAALTLAGLTLTDPVIANIAPSANFTLTQNSVAVINSISASATANTLYLKTGMVGIGIEPTTALDIDSNSNTQCLRLRGADAANEIVDMYVGAGGECILDLTAGSDTNAYFDIKTEDNQYGVIIRCSDGSSTAPYANLYVTEGGTVDYLSIGVTTVKDTDALVIGSNNYVGIGTIPTDQLDILCAADRGFTLKSANYNLALFHRDSGGENGIMAMYGTGAFKVIFRSNGQCYVNNGTAFLGYDGFYVGAAGTATLLDDAANGATSTTLYIGSKYINVTTPSTLLIKKNIVNSPSILVKLKQARVVDFNFKKEYDKDDTKLYKGMIAEELEQLFPDLVNQPDEYYREIEEVNEKGKTGEKRLKRVGSPYKSIRYHDMIPYIIKAIQEICVDLDNIKK